MRTTAFSIDTFYQQIGNGPIIVLLHGWGHSWETWNNLIPFLSSDFQLLIPDLPAFGQSKSPSNPQKWNSEKYVLWLDEFLKQTTNNKKIILVGHSLGGKIAALYSATYPSQIKKLFLISPSGIPDKLSFCKKIQKKVFSMIPHIAKQIMPQKLKNKLLERTGASADYLNASPSQKTILNNIIQENITQFLHKISAPTFLFWGILDQETPYKNHQIFLENIANAELIKFNTGHFPYVENEIEFKKELIKRI